MTLCSEYKLFKRKGFKVLTLYNDRANKSNIITAIRKMRNTSKDKSSILFYFSGHGDGITLKNGDREGYIIPYAFKSELYVPNKLDSMYYDDHAISIRSLVRNAMESKDKPIALLLDSCFSGLAIKAYDTKSVNILTAGTDQKVSDGKRHSPFAKALIQKLEQTDEEDLTFFNLAHYVSTEVRINTKNQQIPQFKTNRRKLFYF